MWSRNYVCMARVDTIGIAMSKLGSGVGSWWRICSYCSVGTIVGYLTWDVRSVASKQSMSCSTHVHITKSNKMILCDLIWQITCNYNRLDGGHIHGIGHRKMAVLSIALDHGNNPWIFPNHVIVLEANIIFVRWNLLEIQRKTGFSIMMLTTFNSYIE